jgi:nucleotide-binding universal stress UspA family protein
VNSTAPERFARRIVVAIDASSHSLAALEAAAELAARLEAELRGVFVEDEQLLQVAELTFLQEVAPFTAIGRPLERQQVQREMHVLARRAQRAFQTIVERMRLAGDFQVVRGAVVSALLAAADEADLLVVGKASRTSGRPRRLGSTSRAAFSGARCSTLVMQRHGGLGVPILVVYDGSSLARRALEAAVALRAREQDPITVLLPTTAERPPARMREEVVEQLGPRHVPVQVLELAAGNTAALAQAVRTRPCGMLVLPAAIELLEDQAVLTLMEELDVPVLLVR